MKTEQQLGKCQFCNKGVGNNLIIDGETQREVYVCDECRGYSEATLQKIDEMIDNEMEYSRLLTRGGLEYD